MPLSPAQIRENPWWSDPTSIERDPHLRRLREQPLIYEHQIPFDLNVDAVYTLRGPRQVGKTTLLKRIIREVLSTDEVHPRDVLYSDITGVGVTTYTALQEYLQDFIDTAASRGKDRRLFLLLDEVTGVNDWGVAIRTLHGRGALRGVTLIATGSHALDVKRGGERAPGRRGAVEHWDWLMMPICFRHFVELHEPRLANLPIPASLEPSDLFQAAEEAHFHGECLRELFDRYLLTGGFPYAIAAEFKDRQISERVYRIYRDAIRGEVSRAELSEPYFRELLSWAGHKRLGQEFSWTSVSSDTTIGSKNTARTYLETAESLFLWHIYYRTLKPDQSRAALKSPKKLYPADPFAWHVLSSWAQGEQNPWKGSLNRLADHQIRGDLVESICADHFRRRFGHFAFYYRSPKGRREVDFALFTDGNPQLLVEIKYQRRIRKKHRKTLAEEGGGILATVDHLRWYDDEGVAAIPVCYLLAILPWEISLFPERE